jgi:membrane-bound lytic murein transglycosylase B
MLGSWAGAMGHTQFMPTTYLAHAVDLDGDGKRDIWGNVGDALASTANYLKVSGWLAAAPWGFEVALPAGFDYGLSAPGRAKRLAEWQALGLSRPAGEAWPATTAELQLMLPAGARGPAFLTSASLRALLRYNASLAYALAVGLLADRLAGKPGVAASWPTGERALSRAEREELQSILTGLGHDTGGVDGIIGSGTRHAIRAYQRARALPEDGFPSSELLLRLRQERRS